MSYKSATFRLFFAGLFLISVVDSSPAKTKTKEQPKVETPTTDVSSGDGEMVASSTCEGVKCHQPGPEKNCQVSNGTLLGGVIRPPPAPTATCCPIFMCDGENGQQYQYAASAGAFPSGPPPGFGYPPAGVPLPGSMPNYQFQQQSAQSFKGPGSQTQQSAQAHQYSSSYSFSYGSNSGNGNANSMGTQQSYSSGG